MRWVAGMPRPGKGFPNLSPRVWCILGRPLFAHLGYRMLNTEEIVSDSRNLTSVAPTVVGKVSFPVCDPQLSCVWFAARPVD